MAPLSDDERDELRASARRFLAERSTTARVRELLDDGPGFDPALWRAMAELGWLAIAVPEAHGGLGGSFADLAVVLHELGRQLTPAPVLGHAVLGAAALAATADTAPAAELLPALAAGDVVVTAAPSNAKGSWDATQLGATWSVAAGRVVLDGAAGYVTDAAVADHLVVSARDAAGDVVVALVDRRAAGVTVHDGPTVDRTRRLARVEFAAVAVPDGRLLAEPAAGADAGRALHERLVALGAIAVMADAVGAAEHLLEITTAYAKERRQFGRAIGGFQAVKHHLADMLVAVESARAAVAFATDAVDSGAALGPAAAVATSCAAPACERVAELAIQVHGGIGFTWEHDAHLFLKRIRLDGALFGTARWHRQRLAGALLDGRLAV